MELTAIYLAESADSGYAGAMLTHSRLALLTLGCALSLGAASPNTAPAPNPGPVPAPTEEILNVVCGEKENVLTWKVVPKANSNSILRSVDGATNEWVCGGPKNIAPCTDLTRLIYVDKDIKPGKTYRYTHKSAPGCASNSVTCPGGASTGKSCVTGGTGPAPHPAPGGGGGGTGGGGSGGNTGGGGGTGGGGTGGGGGGADQNCTGGNPQCICVKNNGAYNRYEGVADQATNAAFPGMSDVPQGMSAEEATGRICAAYNANKTLGANSECRAQADEVVFEDPGAPDPRYPTISVDVITSQGKFWRNAIAACESGVQ